MSTLRFLFPALALATAAPAWATPHELSLELGVANNGDPLYDTWADNDRMVSFGLRGGARIVEHVAVIGSWHAQRHGSDVYTDNVDALAFRTDYRVNEFTLGAKADWEIRRFLDPYVAASFLLYHGRIRIDDDPNTRTNPGQIKASGLAPGGLFVGGLEAHIPKGNAPFTIGGYVEGGYELVARHQYRHMKAADKDSGVTFDKEDSLGSMQPGGFAVRLGVGLRF